MSSSTEIRPKKLSFKQQMMQAREQAVIDVVYKLLATKGYDSMTVDEVVEEVGIAKASLYRHFPSKEALAVAAMTAAMDRAVKFVDDLISQDELENSQKTALDFIKDTVVWVMSLKLKGEMPNLPSENSVLREQLIKSEAYMFGFMHVSDQLGEWIEQAQADGQLDNSLPAIVILYTLYARACDPVLDFLKMGGLYSENEIIDMVMKTCFNGISTGV